MHARDMSTPNRPAGHPTVSPYLICPRAADVIAFAERAFGAKLLRRFLTSDGDILHAEIRIDDSVVMIGGSGDAWPAIPTNLHIYVDDADAVYQRALDAGAVSVSAPEQREGDTDRRGGVRDPDGNTWWIASQVS